MRGKVDEYERREEQAFWEVQEASRGEVAAKRRADEAEGRVTALEEELRRREAAEKRCAAEAEGRVTALEQELRCLRLTCSALQDRGRNANVQPNVSYASDQSTTQAAVSGASTEAGSSLIAGDSRMHLAPSAAHSTSEPKLPPEVTRTSRDNQLLLRCMSRYSIAGRQEQAD